MFCPYCGRKMEFVRNVKHYIDIYRCNDCGVYWAYVTDSEGANPSMLERVEDINTYLKEA